MSDRNPASPLANRWLQCAAGIVCMVMISSLQQVFAIAMNVVAVVPPSAE